MDIKTWKNDMKKAGYKLQHVLTIPFILLITLSVLTTGFFAWRYSEKAIVDLAFQISEQSTIRVEEQINNYLRHAYVSNIVLKEFIANQYIDIKDKQALHRLMMDIVLEKRQIHTLNFAYPDGGYIGAGIAKNGNLLKKVAGEETGRVFYTYELDKKDPSNIKKIGERSDYDARLRPWFKEAQAVSPIWSSVYAMFSSNRLGITLSEEIRNKEGGFLGVIGTDVVFANINQKLFDTKLTEHSLIFILDKQNHVIAQNRLDIVEKKLLYKASDSQNKLLQQVSDYIGRKGYDKAFKSMAKFSENGKQQTYVVNYKPYPYENRLDWRVVVAIPKDDFLVNINPIKTSTIFIGLLFFLGSLLLGWVITYLVSRSMLRLQNSIKKVSYEGEGFAPTNHHIKEINNLSITFSQMAGRLRETYSSVKQSNEILEEAITQRNKELRHANDALLKHTQMDSLSKLANQHSFDELLMHNWMKLNAGDINHLSILVCNIDYFKLYTDTYGSLAGDNCLNKVLQIIFQSIRTIDIVSRYNENDFFIMMPDVSVTAAESVAVHIQTLLANTSIPHNKSTVKEYVTMSIGIATANHDNLTNVNKDILITRANEALLQAKNNGNDCFVINTHSFLAPNES